jgi:hypothetical protein
MLTSLHGAHAAGVSGMGKAHGQGFADGGPLDYCQVQAYAYGMTIVTIATAASQILSNTMNALKIVRERAQSSKDNDLKGHISKLYDNLLLLKEAVIRLT